MDLQVKLSEIPTGSSAIICHVSGDADKVRHLMDLGFTSGADVRPLFSAAAGSPVAYSIRGSVQALRRADSDRIFVHPSSTKGGAA